jgi:hypothetical protein
MRPVLLALIAGGVLALAAASAPAQPAGGPEATLFDQPNFQGRSITVTQGSADLETRDFAAMAMSGRFEGDWSICTRPAFRGRCETVRGDVADLGQLGLSRRINSLRRQGDGAAPPPPPQSADDGYYDRPQPAADEGRAVAGQGVAGHGVVFFYRPQRAGADIPGSGRDIADAFCRDMGYGPAVYFDTDGQILRDVLCRRD